MEIGRQRNKVVNSPESYGNRCWWYKYQLGNIARWHAIIIVSQLINEGYYFQIMKVKWTYPTQVPSAVRSEPCH